MPTTMLESREEYDTRFSKKTTTDYPSLKFSPLIYLWDPIFIVLKQSSRHQRQ